MLFEEDEATRADGVVGSLKLIDFGYAALHKPGERLRGLSGTPDYVAPEVLSWYEGDDQAGDGGGGGVEYDASCDMWSIGVILFILLCGFPPFYAEAEPELIQKVREGQFEFTSPYWDDISASAKDLISRCLALHPEDRPTPTEALRHPWVGGVAAAAQPAQEQEPIAAPASAPPRGSDAQRAPVPPASSPAYASRHRRKTRQRMTTTSTISRMRHHRRANRSREWSRGSTSNSRRLCVMCRQEAEAAPQQRPLHPRPR